METSTRTKVRRVVWGATEKDVQRALDAYDWHPGRDRWEIVDTETTAGQRCPIPGTDPAALGQRTNYGWTWAVYAVEATNE